MSVPEVTPDNKSTIQDMIWTISNFFPELRNQKERLIECANAAWIVCHKGYGDCFAIKDFINCVANGFFTDYDGVGFWVDDYGRRLGAIKCDQYWLRSNQPADAKFIFWCNK